MYFPNTAQGIGLANDATKALIRSRLRLGRCSGLSISPKVGTVGLEAWYVPGQVNGSAGTTGAMVANTAYCLPLMIDDDHVIDAMGLSITAGVAGNGRFGLYTSDANLYPDQLVSGSDGGAYDTTTIAAVKKTSLSVSLTGGTLYWALYVFDATPTIRCLNVNACWPVFGAGPTFGTAYTVGWKGAYTYPGALPSTAPAGLTGMAGAPIPAGHVRFSS